mgnify:FL=1|jgi:4-hydroxythreonine-4-phosphate dehydrogenase
MQRPVIALSVGDVAGIGPEIAVRVLRNEALASAAVIRLYGPEEIIRKAAERFAPEMSPDIVNTGSLPFSSLTPGKLSPETGLLAYHTVVKATQDVIGGKADAIVTCPVNKAAINEAGIPFTGHTELVAELCGTDRFAMMQSAGNLRVIFVTTHIALKDVSAAVTQERIMEVARLVEEAAKAEDVEQPRIAIAGLNPHAGENGHMGSEDEEIVKPAIRKLQESGMKASGPYPSDTLFIDSIRKTFDGIVSMYHDQGHIPFKMLAFDRGVNSTMGLPIIRTSVDHGTAFEIAWKGVADTGSLEAAIHTAIKRANAKRRSCQ